MCEPEAKIITNYEQCFEIPQTGRVCLVVCVKVWRGVEGRAVKRLPSLPPPPYSPPNTASQPFPLSPSFFYSPSVSFFFFLRLPPGSGGAGSRVGYCKCWITGRVATSPPPGPRRWWGPRCGALRPRGRRERQVRGEPEAVATRGRREGSQRP